MTFSEKDALEMLEEARQRNAEIRRQNLALAKAEAAKRGKEPFDLARLEKLADTTREGRVDPVEERQDRFEALYYIDYPKIMTIAEFADKVAELSKW